MGIRATQAAAARELGISRQAINSLVKRGRLPVDAGGKIDLDVARSVVAAMNPGRSKAAANLAGVAIGASAVPPEAAPAAQGTAPAPAPDGEERITSYHVARTLREAYGAKNARLEYLERNGELVNAAEVRRAAFTAARSARDALMSLPARLAAVLAGETSAARCHEILALEIRRVCDEIAAGEARQAAN